MRGEEEIREEKRGGRKKRREKKEGRQERRKARRKRVTCKLNINEEWRKKDEAKFFKKKIKSKG